MAKDFRNTSMVGAYHRLLPKIDDIDYRRINRMEVINQRNKILFNPTPRLVKKQK